MKRAFALLFKNRNIIMRDNIRDICIGLTMLAVLCFCFKGKPSRSMGSCQRCDRMEQAIGGMRQRMDAAPQRGSRSSEGRGEWRKGQEKGKDKK